MYTILPESKENVVWIHVKGRMNSQDYETLFPHFDRIIVQHGTIRILTDLRDFEGIEFWAFLKTPHRAFKYGPKVEKKAVITRKNLFLVLFQMYYT